MLYYPTMIKKLISPFQRVLLARRLCVGCTMPLDKASIREILSEKRIIIQCKCGRRFILDRETNMYRRATLDEDIEYIHKKQKK
jgi:hypothetical protein